MHCCGETSTAGCSGEACRRGPRSAESHTAYRSMDISFLGSAARQPVRERGHTSIGQRCIFYWFCLLGFFNTQIIPLGSYHLPYSPSQPLRPSWSQSTTLKLVHPKQWGCTWWKNCPNSALQISRESWCKLEVPASSIAVFSFLFIPPPTTPCSCWERRWEEVLPRQVLFCVSVIFPSRVPSTSFFLPSFRTGWAGTEF